jgi:penicillin-binding protein 2
MLIFDQLKKEDPPLRALALAILIGLLVLFAGLWWVQIVSGRNYQAHLETQSFRNIRVPAVRGKIFDRNGVALAENQPRFTVGLYLEDLRRQFDGEYARLRPLRVVTNAEPFWRQWLGFDAVKTQPVRLKKEQIEALKWQARFNVASNAVQHIAAGMQQPMVFNPAEFRQHYLKRPVLPYPVMEKLDAAQIARFEEQSLAPLGADLEIQSVRLYPYQTTAAHVLGCLTYDDTSYAGEEASFSYRLPDFRGLVGIEAGFDSELRGRAGARYVLVNNLGFKQSENWSPGEPGQNVVLTLDLQIQQAAERALLRAQANVRGAVVVMNATNGDILALVSAPAPDPNVFTRRLTQAEYDQLNDERMRPQINRATQENYPPGSIFKTVVALAALENGLNPNAVYHVQPNPSVPTKGFIKIGNRTFRDQAPPGDYDFHRALLRSSNCYFITNGLRCGIANIVKVGQRLHLGERIGLRTRQETGGAFPKLDRVTSSAWRDGDTANICIGQGPIAVTPLQMAVLTCALANGGKVFLPRLVDRIEPPDGTMGEAPERFPAGRVRDELGVSARTLRILHDAMLADTEDEEGTAYKPFREYYRDASAMRVCGKTGTAQVTDAHNRLTGHITWFISFAPYERPRYAVVVMVEDGGSGGGTCAPVAREIYAAIERLERGGNGMLAHRN